MLERRLEDRRSEVLESLARVRSLHAGRLVLIPGSRRNPGESAVSDQELLLLESNFDGPAEPHFAALARELGPELGRMLELCEGDARGPLESRLRAGSRRTSVFFSAHPGLGVARVQADARLRTAFFRFLRAERSRVSGRSALRLVEQARAEFLRESERLGFGLSEPALEQRTRGAVAPAPAPMRAELELLPWLLRSLFHDLSDWVRELWTDARLDRSGLAERLERIGAREDSSTQQALTLVSVQKPGRFRRRALRRALAFVEAWLHASEPGARAIGASHFARFVELGDGRLVFLSHHDGSFEAEMGRFVEGWGFLASLVWSHTCGFPASFAAIFGGARDEANFKDWARVKRVPTQIAYSAYPELALGDVTRGAELRTILCGKLDEAAARRALDLV